MSFIYAEKTAQKFDGEAFSYLHIMGDTKFTPVLGAPGIKDWGKKTYSLLARYGLVKSMIVDPKCCVSFAGNNIAYAHDLLDFVYTQSNFSEEQLLVNAFEIHRSAPKNAIEFLICTVNERGEGHITCIKTGKMEKDCPQAWIGSGDTHRALQAQRNFNISKTEQTFSPTDFREAMKRGGDDSVGGFVTNIRYDFFSGQFAYSEGMESHVERDQLVQAGESIPLYADAANGGYLVYYHENPSEFVLSIDQGDLSIVYTNRVKYNEENSVNEHTKHFTIPILMRTSTWTPIEDVIRA